MIRHVARRQHHSIRVFVPPSSSLSLHSSQLPTSFTASKCSLLGNGEHFGSYKDRYSGNYGTGKLKEYHQFNSLRHFSASAHRPDDDNKPAVTEVTKPKKSIVVSSVDALKSVVSSIVGIVKDPKGTWKWIVDGAYHYWVGSKLLVAEIRTASSILGRLRSGHELTRREREHLKRTASDLFRLVPFSIFVIVPFMELLLPLALKLFPNMLPSTFQDQLKKEEDMKKELQMRLAMAGFLHETLETIAQKRQKTEDEKKTAGPGAVKSGAKVIGFLDKLKVGEALPNKEVLEIAALFKDELMLPNMARPQLISLCQYMCLPTYGSDSFLRFQLRNKMKAIKEDDKRILWEGVDSLTVLELREACRDRGMRAHGLNQVRYEKQLRDWLELSIQKNVPISLLIMSRAFMLASPSMHSEDVLKSSINALDKETINEVVLSVASPEEESSADMKLRKLESIQFQEELIKDEREDIKESLEVLKEKELEEEAEAALSNLSASVDLDKDLEALEGAKNGIPPQVAEAAGDILGVDATTPVPSVTAVFKPGKGTAVMVEDIIVNRTLAPGHRGASEDDEVKDTTVPVPEKEEEELPPGVIPVEGGRVSFAQQAEIAHAVHAAVDTAAKAAAAKATTSPKERKKLEKELLEDDELPDFTVYELQAISDLARTSSVQREKEVLTQLQSQVESLLSSKKRVEEAAEAAEKLEDKEPEELSEEDKSINNLLKVLSRMNTHIESKINSTEKVLGDKLKILDKDEDGSISVQELKEGVIATFKQSEVSEEDINELIDVLDKDKDGKVSVPELIKYVEELKEKKEAELLEATLEK